MEKGVAQSMCGPSKKISTSAKTGMPQAKRLGMRARASSMEAATRGRSPRVCPSSGSPNSSSELGPA